VNIGYRLSAFGFLACDKPRIEGNFGFKDQWMALEWVYENIYAFGGATDALLPGALSFSNSHSTGDPENIQVTGLSAGTVPLMPNPKQTHNSSDAWLGNCRCSLCSSNITPRFEVATWCEGAVQFRCFAVECYGVSLTTYPTLRDTDWLLG